MYSAEVSSSGPGQAKVVIVALEKVNTGHVGPGSVEFDLHGVSGHAAVRDSGRRRRQLSAGTDGLARSVSAARA